ncbi:MAG: phosphodiester glycosidase family protein [Clostridia bacterium]|jgi:hypothetical protein|nr:phosphodiester glycosidase family protein [Clostridia bacterium]
MKHAWKRGLLMLLAGLFLLSGASADSPVTGPGPEWHLDEKGFLIGDNPGEAWLLEDEENGIWQYSSADLSVRVTRFTEQANKKQKRVYCVAEVYASERSPLYPILHPQVGNDPVPGCHKEKADKLVENYPSVLAISDDYYGHRYQTRKTGAKWPTGIIIRNGKILFDKTRDSSRKAEFPPLDTMAVYPDGSLKVRVCDELTAEEYLAEGATNVFSFGPWLIRNGEVNEKGATGKKATYSTLRYNSSGRAVIGMVEPFHYILIVVGRPDKNKYLGANGDWLIAKLQEYGCVEAFNLDGGGTACMAFNGKVIIRGDNSKRPLCGMIAFGNLE